MNAPLIRLDFLNPRLRVVKGSSVRSVAKRTVPKQNEDVPKRDRGVYPGERTLSLINAYRSYRTELIANESPDPLIREAAECVRMALEKEGELSGHPGDMVARFPLPARKGPERTKGCRILLERCEEFRRQLPTRVNDSHWLRGESLALAVSASRLGLAPDGDPYMADLEEWIQDRWHRSNKPERAHVYASKVLQFMGIERTKANNWISSALKD